MIVNLSIHVQISSKINHVIARDKLLSLDLLLQSFHYSLTIFKIVQSRTGFLQVADPLYSHEWNA